MGALDQPARSVKRSLISVVVVIASIGLCILAVSAGLDVACRADIDNWVPIYPGAEIVEMEYQGPFRPRAMGATAVMLYSEDPPNVVRSWYYQHIVDLARRRVSRGFATTSREIEAAPDGEGTHIYLFSTCAWY